MAKKLSKKELFKLIKEAVAKKVNLLREDIDIDDEEIWDYYDDNLYNDWQNNYSKMPKGYDDDVTDLDTIDRMGRMNSDIDGSPALKRAQIKASWAASDREDISNANKLSNQYEDNYYNDSNANTDPDASAWYSDSYNKNLKLGLKDWNKNGPNENKRYDGHKAFMKEEVDMGQVASASNRRSAAKVDKPEIRKELRKLRNMIDEYEEDGKDTSALIKRIEKLKREFI